MKTAEYIYVFILVCIPVLVMAHQEDSISKRQTVSPERQMLLEKFRDGKLDSVSSLLDSLDVHPPVPLLWPAERLLLYYWLERYHAIDSLLNHFDEICEHALSNHPAEQVVWNVLSFHSLENKEILVSWIEQSGCGDLEYDFRVQLLKFMILGEWDDQVSVNRNITAFVNQYPLNEEEISQKNIQPDSEQPVSKTNDAPWSIGLGFGLGPAYVSGKLAKYFSTSAGLSLNANIYYKRWVFPLSIQPIFAKLKRDIPIGDGDDVWEAGSMALITNFGFACGYSVVDNKFLKLNPFLGLSISECTPGEQNIEDNEILANAGIRWGFTYLYGIDIGFKINNMIGFLKRSNISVLFNVRLNHIPSMFNNVNPRYSGNINFVCFGLNVEFTKW